jgi:hypothetical protein
MPQTLLVTIKGPRQRRDVELPGDIPLYELLPALLDICGITEDSVEGKVRSPENVSLYLERLNDSLTSTFTLLESGVLTGDILFLQSEGEELVLLPANADESEVIESDSLAGGMGVTWLKDW